MINSLAAGGLSGGTDYRAVLTAIVQRCMRFVGAPAALSVAGKVPKLVTDAGGNVLAYDAADPLATVTSLIGEYEATFGQRPLQAALEEPRPSAPAESLRLPASLPRVAPRVIRLLLVDDHALFRSGLHSVIAPEPDFDVVGQAESVNEAIALADVLRPDMVLMDFRLPDGTGVDATLAILAQSPATQIVFLTVNEDDDALFAAMRAGAQGYLLKSVRAAVLVERLRGVAAGEPAIAPAMALRILKEFAAAPAATRQLNDTVDLTAREIEIVRELASGAMNREIAARFVISENTVKNHVRNVLAKLHLRNRREVAAYARTHGLLARADRPR